MRCYLAGPITGLTYGECTDWREHAVNVLEAEGIEALSPMRGKHFILKRIGGEERLGQTYEDSPMSTQKGIVARDRFDVMRSDVVIFNFLGATERSIGSCVELGWCDAFRKVAIVVIEKNGNCHDHAFVREIAGYRVDSLDEALELVALISRAGHHGA